LRLRELDGERLIGGAQEGQLLVVAHREVLRDDPRRTERDGLPRRSGGHRHRRLAPAAGRQHGRGEKTQYDVSVSRHPFPPCPADETLGLAGVIVRRTESLRGERNSTRVYLNSRTTTRRAADSWPPLPLRVRLQVKDGGCRSVVQDFSSGCRGGLHGGG